MRRMRQDQRRLEAVREVRRRQAERFFGARADAWDQERALAIDPVMVEAALRELFAQERPANLLDIGTGTGRILAGAGRPGRLRARHRPQPRHAGGRARQSRPARGAQLPGPSRRHVPAAAARRLVRGRDPASGPALRRRPVRRPGRGRARARAGRLAGGGRSRRITRSSGCASRAGIAGSASATRRSAAGSRSSG